MLYIVCFFLIIVLLWNLRENNKNKGTTSFEVKGLSEIKGQQQAELKELSLKMTILQQENKELKDKLNKEYDNNMKILSSKKSSETKFGLVAENALPLLSNLPYDSTNLRHLGSPVDYLYFNFNGKEGPEVVIIEVKSGNSKESKRQRMIKNAIRLGKVFYEEVRIDEKGIKIKRATNEE